MNNPLRPIFYISLFCILLVLERFTDLSKPVLFLTACAIALIILFAYVFKRYGLQKVKIFLIIFAYIAVPMTILFISGILNAFPAPWGGLISAFVTSASALLAILTIVRLQLVGVVVEDDKVRIK